MKRGINKEDKPYMVEISRNSIQAVKK